MSDLSEVSAAENLGDLVAILAKTHDERIAVRGERSVLSFRALHGAADRWARSLRAVKGGVGRRVGLWVANCPEWLTVAFGVWRAGATLVPLSTFATERELAETFADADLDLLIMQPRVASHDFVALLDRIPRSRWPAEIVAIGEDVPAPVRTAESFLADGPNIDATPIDPGTVACLLYTSGTSGRPKGVLLSHRGILATVRETARRSGLTPEDRMLSTPPLFWVAGLVIRALPTLTAGCELLLPETFRVEKVIALLERHRPTALHLRPPQAAALISHPAFRPDLLDRVRRATGRIEWYAPHLDSSRARFTTGYGMTEMSGYVMSSDWRDAPAKEPCLRLMPGVEVRVVDEVGRDCSAGETGEIYVRGPGLFVGYQGQPPGAALDESGFFATGDLGRVDSNGALEFVGRRKDLLRAKGINVSPLEIERVLADHPDVDAVYVVGVPGDGTDQRLVALVVPRSGRPIPKDDLVELARRELSHYKRPELYLRVSPQQIPLGATAKPKRDALAALAADLVEKLETSSGSTS